MKKIIAFTIFCLSYVLMGCSEHEEILETSASNEMNGLKVIDNVIHFDNHESYENTIVRLNSMGQTARSLWEESIGFRSNRTRAFEGYDLLCEADNEEEFNEILSTYSDVLYRDGNTIRQYVEPSEYSGICNNNGIFFIGKTAHKITPEYELISEEGDVSKLEFAARNIAGTIKGIIAIPLGKSDLLKSSTLNCASKSFSDMKEFDPDGLTMRKIELYVSTFSKRTPLDDGTGRWSGSYHYTVKTISYKKVLGRYVKYNTVHWIRDFKVGMMTPNVSGSTFNYSEYYPGYRPFFEKAEGFIGYSYTSTEEKEWVWASNEQIGYAVYYYTGFTPFGYFPGYIKSISGKVWHRGLQEESNALVISESCN